MPVRPDLARFHLISSYMRFSRYDQHELVRRHVRKLHIHLPYYRNAGYKSRFQKNPYIYLERIVNIRRTISGSTLIKIHILPGLEGYIGVNQSAMDRKKYREINEIQKSIWIVIYLTRKIQQIFSNSAFVYVYLSGALHRRI